MGDSVSTSVLKALAVHQGLFKNELTNGCELEQLVQHVFQGISTEFVSEQFIRMGFLVRPTQKLLSNGDPFAALSELKIENKLLFALPWWTSAWFATCERVTNATQSAELRATLALVCSTLILIRNCIPYQPFMVICRKNLLICMTLFWIATLWHMTVEILPRCLLPSSPQHSNSLLCYSQRLTSMMNAADC
eukprot:TRINITY_DN9085_c0_g2_i3.p2 TRINITY_DN9085_c0_g2~~TRINITY_DN9085_c0_g2_i3.p2  ORF type:complete len:192 (-),score=21.22 TRINITY_DN9085_c0_g2_i3:64-639(-)